MVNLTPRHIIQMMSELVAPNIDIEDTKICDVSCELSGNLNKAQSK